MIPLAFDSDEHEPFETDVAPCCSCDCGCPHTVEDPGHRCPMCEGACGPAMEAN